MTLRNRLPIGYFQHIPSGFHVLTKDNVIF